MHLDRVQIIMRELGNMEDEIFQMRRTDAINFKAQRKSQDKHVLKENFQVNMASNCQINKSNLELVFRPKRCCLDENENEPILKVC